jgi:hypothetical protein
MANNYLQFSTTLPLADDEQRAWATEVIEFLRRWGDWQTDANDDTYGIAAALTDDYLGFEIQIQDGDLWMYAEESGTPENAVAVMQAYLRQFHPEGSCGFEWATTCSRPRPGEFSGGAVFVTATTAEWMPAGQWLADKTKAFEAAHGA